MRWSRVIEWAKTVLIVLLIVSSLLLGWQTGQFDELINSVPFFGSVAQLMRGTQEVVGLGAAPIIEAARPLVIVIAAENEGPRFGVKYDTVLRNDVYDRTSSIIIEALGSAFEPSQMSQVEWREALSGAMLYYEYAMPVRLSILYAWFGVPVPDHVEDALIRRVFVAFGEGRNRVFYHDIATGFYFGADTASVAGRPQDLEAMDTDEDVLFAFESGIAAADDAPYAFLTMGRSAHPDVHATAAGSTDELLDLTLDALGYGYESYTPYPVEGGTIVRVGTQFNIRADVHGSVLFRRTDGPHPAASESQAQSEGELIEIARAIVSDTIGGACGYAEVFFESIEMTTQDVYTVSFNYYLAGGRVFLFEDNHAARITIMSGLVVEVDLNYRYYSFTGESTRLMPELQALAAAGGEFILSYTDSGTEWIQPFWGEGF